MVLLFLLSLPPPQGGAPARVEILKLLHGWNDALSHDEIVLLLFFLVVGEIVDTLTK
jgi:hypothetical protein